MRVRWGLANCDVGNLGVKAVVLLLRWPVVFWHAYVVVDLL